MRIRRWKRAIAGLCVLGSVSIGLVSAAAAGTTSDSSGNVEHFVGNPNASKQFANLKKIKAPKPCKDDTGISDSEIKVGTIVPTSGPYALFYSNTLDGIQARVDMANETGELGDRKITLTNVDDGGETSRNVTAAQQLAEQDNVFGIITETPAGDASGKYLNQQGVPVVGWQLGLPVYGTYTNYFGMQNANAKEIATTYTTRNADVVKALGGTKLAAVATNTANGKVFIDQLTNATKLTKGLKSVYRNTDIPPGTSDFGAIAQEIKDSGADSLYTALDSAGNSGLMAALKQAGVTLKPVIFPGGYDPRVVNLPTYADVYFGIEWKPFEITPSWKGLDDFKEWMAKTSPKAPLGQITSAGWLSANTFIEGIKAAGMSCPTREAFINNLRMEKGYTADGFFSDIPIDFSEVYNQAFDCVYYVHVENGGFVPQFEGKPLCGKKAISGKKITKTGA